MDPQLIASVATSVITLVVAFLTKTGEAAAIKTGEDLYRQVKGRFRSRSAASAALAELETQPRDVDLQAAVHVQLRKVMKEDSAFAAGISQMLPSVNVNHGAGAGRDLTIGRDFVGGDRIDVDTRPQDPFMDAWERGNNLSRPVLIFGQVIMVGGFALWMMTIFNLIGGGSSASFDAASSIISTNGPVAFGCIILGAVIMMIARMMGRRSRN